MDFRLSEEQTMLRDGARRFVAQQYSFEARRELTRSPLGFSAAHWQTFADLGWLALGLPEDVGGLGCSSIETALLMEAFGNGLLVEPYASSTVLAAHILDRSPNKPVRDRCLPLLGAGQMRIALADIESQGRADHARLATVAKPTAGGFQLTGRKSLALDGGSADKLIVTAHIEGQHGLALFLVGRQAAGVTTRDYALIDSTRAADADFQQVSLEASALLAAPSQGAVDILDDAWDRFLLARVAEALGAMETAMEITAEYVRSRVQFGQPLIKFQATQHRLAEMFVEVQEVRSILYFTLANIDGPTAARQRAVAAAVTLATNSARVVGDLSVQLHGGIGMTDEYRIGHYYKKLVAFTLLYGGKDTQPARLAAGY
jgi:alkylation response protein AidB-like acyl-CoA dehydrogenase